MKEYLYYSIPNDELLMGYDHHLYTEGFTCIWYFPFGDIELFMKQNNIVYIGEV